MSRYVDADEILRQLRFAQNAESLKDSKILAVIISDFEKMQEHIVRCKNCKYWLPHTQCGDDIDYDEYHNYCEMHMPDDEWYAGYWEADDYCSFGERKEQEDEDSN